MENLSNCSSNDSVLTGERGIAYISYKVAMLVCVLIPLLLLHFMLLITIIRLQRLNHVLRIVLANIPSSCLLVGLGFGMDHLATIVLWFQKDIRHPVLIGCRFIIYIVAVGGSARYT